jgi:hypothetical protein
MLSGDMMQNALTIRSNLRLSSARWTSSTLADPVPPNAQCSYTVFGVNALKPLRPHSFGHVDVDFLTIFVYEAESLTLQLDYCSMFYIFNGVFSSSLKYL